MALAVFFWGLAFGADSHEVASSASAGAEGDEFKREGQSATCEQRTQNSPPCWETETPHSRSLSGSNSVIWVLPIPSDRTPDQPLSDSITLSAPRRRAPFDFDTTARLLVGTQALSRGGAPSSAVPSADPLYRACLDPSFSICWPCSCASAIAPKTTEAVKL